MVYCDIKLFNLLFVNLGEVKLSDFGIVYDWDVVDLMDVGFMVGLYFYMLFE